VLFKHH